MKINSEFSLISFIEKRFPPVSSQIVKGIGDDCSVLEWDDQSYLITSTDMLIEDIHFKANEISPEDLGWKSLAVTYSDLAAMGGGEPMAIYLSLGLPDLKDNSFLEQFFNGVEKCINEYGGSLVGGDTVKSNKITINILIKGKIKKSNIKYRHKVETNDLICVARNIGGSEVGLNYVLGKIDEEQFKYFKNIHHKPIPQLKEANWLSQFDAVHGMIDISDGLLSDLDHLCQSSNLFAEVDIGKIPMDQDTIGLLGKRSFCEDYSILFSMCPKQFDIISNNFAKKFGEPIYPIGKFLEKRNSDLITFIGESPYQLVRGFEHFS